MTPIDAARLRAIAVRASADPRSVQRELATPGAVRGLPGHRIREALREVGLAAPSLPATGMLDVLSTQPMALAGGPPR